MKEPNKLLHVEPKQNNDFLVATQNWDELRELQPKTKRERKSKMVPLMFGN